MINWAFLAKMGCIVVAGAVTWVLWRSLRAQVDAEAGSEAAVAIPTKAKLLAGLSLVLWLLAITFGRLIAYIMDHAILNGQA